MVKPAVSPENIVTDRVMVLPTGTALGLDDVARVVELLSFLIAHADEVKDRLEAIRA